MKSIMGLGLDRSGQLLFPPASELDFSESLVSALPQNGPAMEHLANTTKHSFSFRSEVVRQVQDEGNPRSAGWTFLVNETDPQRKDLERIIAPLAQHRGMVNSARPLLYHNEPPEDWLQWVTNEYQALRNQGRKVPQYILILGTPDQVPFGFQSMLNTLAKVGRVCFDRPTGLDDLQQYVAKVIRLETVSDPTVTRETLLFATDGGSDDPTFYSRQYMVEPLTRHIRDELGFKTRALLAYEATKTNLVKALENSKPALVFAASHGLGPSEVEQEDFQRAYNGALCCQHVGSLTMSDLFSAQDVPYDQPFLEGAVFFQFACFGYGTPAQSDYAHWWEGVPKRYVEADFVAALPQQLLAHPRGPMAYVGHLDTAWLHAFADPGDPVTSEPWHGRIAPFVSAVDELLGVQPCGLGMKDMAARYNVGNRVIAEYYDRLKRGMLEWDQARKTHFLDTWITRSDAQNYMVFGDPGAALRIPAA